MGSETETKPDDKAGGDDNPGDPCSSPGVCGSAVTGIMQMLLGAGSITTGVFLLIEDNDWLPGVPIWGGAMVSGVDFN